MDKPPPDPMQYRVVVITPSGRWEVVERDISRRRAAELQQLLSEMFSTVLIEEQEDDERFWMLDPPHLVPVKAATKGK